MVYFSLSNLQLFSLSTAALQPFFSRSRETDGECGAGAGLALHVDFAVVVLHDAVNGGEAEAHAVSLFFGGEERLEHVGEILLPDSLAGVLDGEGHLAPGAVQAAGEGGC